MFERFTWELRAKLPSAHQAPLAWRVAPGARPQATTTRPPRRPEPAPTSSTTPHQRSIPGPSPPPAPVSTAVCPNRRPPCPKHPKNAHFHRSGLHFEHASQKSHVISLGQFLISPTNVAIPTMPIQCLKGLHGNYVRNCRAHNSPAGPTTAPRSDDRDTYPKSRT